MTVSLVAPDGRERASVAGRNGLVENQTRYTVHSGVDLGRLTNWVHDEETDEKVPDTNRSHWRAAQKLADQMNGKVAA